MTFEIVFVLLSLLGMMAALIADKMRPGMVLFSEVLLKSVWLPKERRMSIRVLLRRWNGIRLPDMR